MCILQSEEVQTCVAAHVIGSELPGSAVLETQLKSLMLLGRDPGAFSPLSAQLWANLSSSECLCLQSNSLLTSWSPGSQAQHTWFFPGTASVVADDTV